jgi:hypothetical protein
MRLKMRLEMQVVYAGRAWHYAVGRPTHINICAGGRLSNLVRGYDGAGRNGAPVGRIYHPVDFDHVCALTSLRCPVYVDVFGGFRFNRRGMVGGAVIPMM